ncbi:MAG: polysaccharide deacetylase family protein [Flavipsychrobacter sp.]|nr:polysaccharide deacetylase family protein [Flavipsychrobacter sp.]
MVSYWVKTPQWLKKLFPREMIWDMPVSNEPVIYLTFDDGPHPTATPFVLEQLAKYNATGTFFCVGENVARYPEIYGKLIENGHTTGNHTYNHVNGWRTDNAMYLKNIIKAKGNIHSRLFRPPYGRIRLSQARKLHRSHTDWQIYMWDILSGDFDRNITPQQCLDNVLAHIAPGSIIVFHDSDKAWERMSFALPHVLEYCKQQSWKVMALPQ